MPVVAQNNTKNSTFDMLILLPENITDRIKNAFEMSIMLARPVVDLAIEHIEKNNILTDTSFIITYEDTECDVSTASNRAIRKHCENRLDSIIGFANAYCTSTAARLVRMWNEDGVPVITTTGMTSSLDDKLELPTLTRMSGSYNLLGGALVSVIERFDWSWNRVAFLYNNPSQVNTSINMGTECYFQVLGYKHYWLAQKPHLEERWQTEVSSVAFSDQDLQRMNNVQRINQLKHHVIHLAKKANGKYFVYLY